MGLGFLLACSPEIDQPELADLGATLAAYDSPPGVLTRENAAELLATASTRLRGLSLANPQQLMAAVVGDLNAELETRGLVSSDSTERSEVSVDASIRLRLVCPGPSSYPPGTDPGFGKLSLATRIDDNELAAVIQGPAEKCIFPASLLEENEPNEEPDQPSARLDGTVFLYRYDSLLTPAAEARFLIVVAGALSTTQSGGVELRDFDARLLGPVLEMRIDAGGGDVIAFLEGDTLGVRDAKTRYTCDLPARTCSAADGTPLAW